MPPVTHSHYMSMFSMPSFTHLRPQSPMVPGGCLQHGACPGAWSPVNTYIIRLSSVPQIHRPQHQLLRCRVTGRLRGQASLTPSYPWHNPPRQEELMRSVTPAVERHQSPEFEADDAQLVVESFFDALNARDISGVISLVDHDVLLEDLSHDKTALGQLSVARFFTDLMACLPDTATFVLEDTTCGDPRRVAVMWRLDAAGIPLPCSCGITFFCLNGQGLISRIRQAPEHFPKMGGWAQGSVGRITSSLVNKLPLPDVLNGLSAAGSAIAASGFMPSVLSSFGVSKQSTHNPARQITPRSSRSEQATPVPAAVNTQSPPVTPRTGAPVVDPQLHTAASKSLPLAVLSGVWSKDMAASDKASYERALDVWEIHGPQRATAHLIEGMEIKAQDDRFDVHFLTIIPMFKVTERYVHGKPARIMRRDLRSGEAQATLRTHTQGAITFTTWKHPHAGSLEEDYSLSSCGRQLTIKSTLTVGQRTEVTVNVWQRCEQHVTAKDLLHKQEKTHGSATKILKRFNLPV